MADGSFERLLFMYLAWRGVCAVLVEDGSFEHLLFMCLAWRGVCAVLVEDGSCEHLLFMCLAWRDVCAVLVDDGSFEHLLFMCLAWRGVCAVLVTRFEPQSGSTRTLVSLEQGLSFGVSGSVHRPCCFIESFRCLGGSWKHCDCQLYYSK